MHRSDGQLAQPDRTAKKTNGFLQAHIHPQSVTLILCAARANRSLPHLQTKSLFSSRPGLHDASGSLHGCFPTTLRTRTLTQGPLSPVSHRTMNTISLAIDIDHDRPCGIVVPRTHTSSSLRTSILHRLVYSHSCAIFGLAPWSLPSLGLGMWPSDVYSSTRMFGSVTAQIGVLVFASDVAGSALY